MQGLTATAFRPAVVNAFAAAINTLRRELQIKLEEDRKRLVEAINTTFSNLGSASLALLDAAPCSL
jgi:hypothetical protein